MDDDVVVRFVPTYVDEHGTRTLMHVDGSHATFASREEAQAWLDAVIESTGSDRIRAAWGTSPRFDVRTCRCRPVDFAPLDIYFECW